MDYPKTTSNLIDDIQNIARQYITGIPVTNNKGEKYIDIKWVGDTIVILFENDEEIN